MEYIGGGTLQHRISELQGTPMPSREVLSVLTTVCNALSKAHRLGIIHCDLKPENFLVTTGDDTRKIHSQVKLTDFGLAVASPEQKEKSIKGTLGYIAPEILQAEKFNSQVDLYSLGVIFYQALTGKLPFGFSDPALLMAAQIEQKPTPPAEINPKIPPALDELTLKLLEAKPTKRVSTIKEVQIVLENLSKKEAKENFFFNYLESGKPIGFAR